MTLFKALIGEAFDCLNWQYSGEFDQNFSKRSNAPGFVGGGGGEGMGGFGIDRHINLFIRLPHCSFYHLLFFGDDSELDVSKSSQYIRELDVSETSG